MIDRRRLIAGLAAPALLPALPRPAALDGLREAVLTAERAGRTPDEDACDEDLWREVQQAYTCDRSMVNFNNGGVSPAPAYVQEAMARHLATSNEAPSYSLWRVLEPRKESVRTQLARFAGVDREELALTRNASEGLQICQCGFDLSPGDQVLTTNQDYGRMLTTFRQRERRDGIELVTFSLPTPAEDEDEVVRRFETHMTERTRLVLLCQVINLTGQVLPVRRIVEAARSRGIPAVVDGAHGFACLDQTIAELGCDYYATSLHKWLCAPHGTGLLYVRRDRIGDLWPLQAAAEHQDEDIRKFEEIGTHPAANTLAIAEALTFHQAIGSVRKLARLVYLRDRWARRLLANDRVRLHTSLEPGLANGIATFEVEGLDSAELGGWLWREHRIVTTTIQHAELEGVRVSPHVYSTLDEVDRFAEAVEHAIEHGLPA